MEELTGREYLTPVGKQIKVAGLYAQRAAAIAGTLGAALISDGGA